MKYVLLGGAGIMVMIVMISTIFYYQNPEQFAVPKPRQIEMRQDFSQTPEEPQAVHPDETITYSLQTDALEITFDQGEEWITVPVEKEQLFAGEYNGDQQELIDKSYILTEERAAFLYTEDAGEGVSRIVLTYSDDQGQSWEKSVVTEQFPALRFRKVDFVNDSFGYVILSGDRVVAQEYSSIFTTHDGGANWEEVNRPDMTRLIADGGFVDEQTAFLSVGTMNPEEPEMYRTEDGGQNWQAASFDVPEPYLSIFVQAEIPVKEKDQLTLRINQGPNGDYEGGQIKGKFISEDNGKTWSFAEEVTPNE